MFKRKRSIKLGKGVRLNLGKKGISSLSVGGKGLTMNLGSKGVKATASIRGTGISQSATFFSPKAKQSNVQVNEQDLRKVSLLLGLGIIIFPYIFAWLLLRPGYSNVSRVISFTWMVFLIYSYGSKTI